MLKQRLLTAIILIPIFIFLVLKLSSSAFYFLTALIVLGGAWEWSFFMGITHFPRYLVYPGLIIFSLLISFFFPIKSVLYASLGWWLIAAYLVMGYSKNSLFLINKVTAQGLIGLLVL